MDDPYDFATDIAALIAAHRMAAEMRKRENMPGFDTVWRCRGCGHESEAIYPVMEVEANHQAAMIVAEIGLVELDEDGMPVETVTIEGRVL